MWPEDDVDCASVTFGQIKDADEAIKLCKKHDVVVQAGGNCGQWPLHLAKFFGSVFTFEADPDNFECLAQNTRNVNNIFCIATAVGDGGRAGMDYPEGRRNMGAARILTKPDGSIRISKIDELALAACDLIQLDIEGFEPYAIAGAANTILTHRPVVMIEDKGLSEAYGYPEGWSTGVMEFMGYRFHSRINRDNIFVPGER
jgi:FkbM family methyltransferase